MQEDKDLSDPQAEQNSHPILHSAGKALSLVGLLITLTAIILCPLALFVDDKEHGSDFSLSFALFERFLSLCWGILLYATGKSFDIVYKYRMKGLNRIHLWTYILLWAICALLTAFLAMLFLDNPWAIRVAGLFGFLLK